jgi:hypothetical protein
VKPLRCFYAFLIFFAVASAWAEVTFKPLVGLSSLSGKTSYDITFGGYDSALGEWGMESKLEYDLKAVMTNIGLEAGLAQGAWVFFAEYGFSASEGSGKMRDRDWFYDEAVNQYYGWDSLVGDTSSDTTSPIHTFDLGVKARFVKRRGMRLYGLLDYEYIKLGTFYINDLVGGYNGYLTGGVNEYYDEKYSSPILSYEVHYNYFRTGLSMEVDLGAGFELEGTARVGFVSYSDTDDHIARSRIANGSGHGYGEDCTGVLSWKSKGGFGASAFARYQSLSGDGSQNQYYYGGQYQGLSSHVSQTVSSNQSSFGLEMFYKFDVKRAAKKRPQWKRNVSSTEQPAVVKDETTKAQVVAVPVATVEVKTLVVTPQASTTPVLSTQAEMTPSAPGNPIITATSTPSVPTGSQLNPETVNHPPQNHD